MDRFSEMELLNRRLITCRACPRLTDWREQIARTKRKAFLDQDYWGRPVVGFGDLHAAVVVVGLAPGAHGSNRTGRMFTGDGSGDFLFPALFRAGFANQPSSTSILDRMTLTGLYITSICRCAPPNNKPTPEEIKTCEPFLELELEILDQKKVIVALGQLAYKQVEKLYRKILPEMPRPADFGHGSVTKLGDGLPWLIGSYHPSRQNTQTGRLTAEMFDQIWHMAGELSSS
jgi:uracil-DNA glycosylase family 4